MPHGVVASEFPSHLSLLHEVRLGPESIIPANRYIELNEIDTVLLVTNLSALGRTVSHAFHAAVILVSRDWQNRHLLQGSDAKVIRYMSHITCDSRRFQPRRVQDPASVHHTLSHKCLVVDVRSSKRLPVLIPDWQGGPPPGVMSLNGALGRMGTLLFNCLSTTRPQSDQTEFLVVMQQIKKFYAEAEAEAQAEAEAEPEINPDPLEDIDMAEPELVSFLERSDQKPMLVFLPGMNNIDQIMRTNIGTLHIERPVITRFVFSRDIIMSILVHENRLTFSASWNGPWHMEDRVQELMDNCVDKVFEGLGLRPPVAAGYQDLQNQFPPVNTTTRIEPEVPAVIPGRRWIVPPIRELLGQYF
ncbi:hypothetical protein M0657_005597 [Pyricularia oryzae]|nr:hypothetical protein M9X92_007949 [Pyricularia oryzae]KAI7922470.1 hypothetical protein M0657_005597 [Pyricularia oryzae]